VLNAVHNFIVFQQIAAAGIISSLFYGRNESRFVLQYAIHCFLDYLCQILAGSGREQMKTSFLVRG